MEQKPIRDGEASLPVSQIQEHYQIAIDLHITQHWSYATIARHLNVPIGTIKARICRGRKVLSRSASQMKINPFAASTIQRLLPLLPQRYQTVVRLHDVEHLSYAAIARLHNLPIGTVKSLVFRGRKLLSAALSSTF